MLAFFISILFGVGEMLLLGKLLRAVTCGDKKHAALYLMIKLVTYAAAAALLVLKFFSYYLYCFCGYAVGMPLCAVVLFVYNAFIKKGDDAS